MSKTAEGEIVQFQIAAAGGWIVAGNAADLPQLKYVAYFTAFNALYWMWGMFDNKHDKPERERINHLVAKLGPDVADAILQDQKVIEYIGHLRERGAIRDMKFRNREDSRGSKVQGNKCLVDLDDTKNTTARICGLASALYLIRCNLVHGSKLATDADTDLTLRSNPSLLLLTESCLKFTVDNPPT